MEELPGDIRHIIKDAGHVAVKRKWKSGPAGVRRRALFDKTLSH